MQIETRHNRVLCLTVEKQPALAGIITQHTHSHTCILLPWRAWLAAQQICSEEVTNVIAVHTGQHLLLCMSAAVCGLLMGPTAPRQLQLILLYSLLLNHCSFQLPRAWMLLSAHCREPCAARKST
jgi:hypothetical protein